MSIEELKEKLFAVNGIIGLILKESGYYNSYDLCCDYDTSSKEECMLYSTFSDIMSHLSYSNMMLEYLQKPVKKEGIITKARKGYKLDKIKIKEGDCLEILEKSEEDSEKWHLIICGNVHKIEGMYARIRK